jgi:hypothetical protein
MHNFINEFVDLLPKNVLIFKYTKKNNYVYNFRQIIICDDYFMKYNLLKNPDLLLENNNRIMFVDEIDSIMDPLTSEFNLMINTSNIIPEKESLFYLIYKIVDEYNKLKDKNTKSIRNLFKKIYDESQKCEIKFLLEKFINCMFYDRCPKENIDIGIYYLFKKLYYSLLSLNKLILNKDYGLSFEPNDPNYFYAQPYSGINLPIKDSLFNDYILTLVLTTNIFINNIRDDDIFNIIKLIVTNNFKNEKIIKLKKILLNSSTKLSEKIRIIKEFMEVPTQRYLLVEKYIIHFILEKIEYLDEFINTSFIEILNPVLYKNCIGFTGTAESILIPKINDKQIFMETFFIEELKENSFKSLIMSNNEIKPTFTKFNSNEDIISALLSDFITNYQVIIDAGAYLRNKKIKEYVKDFLKYKDYVIYFDDNDKAIISNKDYKEEEFISIDKQISKDSTYLILYDNNHCRGTDLKLPPCKGILTINNFNNSVDILQSLYRLRQINNIDDTKRQSIDYYYANIDTELSIDNLIEYLKDKTSQNIKNKEKDFIIQVIKSNEKFYKENIIKYDIIKINNFIYPKDKDDIINIKKDLKNESIFKLICTQQKLYASRHCCSFSKLKRSDDVSLSISTNINTNINTNTNTNTNTNINNFIMNSDIKYIEIKNLEKRLMNSNNINDINKILVKENYYINLYEYYLICLDYARV